MSLRAKVELAKIKPLSRFVEHFDLMPPTELLDASSVEEFSSGSKDPKSQKKLTPPYALSHHSKLSIRSIDQVPSNALYSPTSPTLPINQAPPIVVDSTQINVSSSSYQESFVTGKEIDLNSVINSSRARNVPKSTICPSPSHSTSRKSYKLASGLDLSIFKQGTFPKSHHNSPKPTGSRVEYTQTSLNRAEIIIKRYESWDKFLSLISTWIADIVRLSIKSQKVSATSMKASKSEKLNSNLHATHHKQHGYTADLASSSLEEKKNYSERLKTQLPILKKLRKENTANLKALKARVDLNLEEFLKRAEVTANLMAQLKLACKEARRTIEKGAQLTNDPWLANLYVLRQLKKEVDEENRLKLLMIPIQQALHDFETRVMVSVEQAFVVCFERPNLIQEDKLTNLQASLNSVIADNWDTFLVNNSKSLVNESYPQKDYLKINYACKNDPLVMTLHKGELERRSGVLNKYTQRLFVLTESGFMHQFKLNDRISPEYSIYVPGSTIIPSLDISHLNLSGMDEQKHAKPSDCYSFELQRSGSVLQRDKSFAFRTFRLEEMVIWSRLLSDVATRPLDAVLQPKNTTLIARPMASTNHYSSAENSAPASPELVPASLKQIQVQNMLQAQDQETTPPPSPIEIRKTVALSSTIPVNDNHIHPPSLPVMASIIQPQSSPASIADFEGSNALKPRLYSPQLNI